MRKKNLGRRWGREAKGEEGQRLWEWRRGRGARRSFSLGWPFLRPGCRWSGIGEMGRV